MFKIRLIVPLLLVLGLLFSPVNTAAAANYHLDFVIGWLSALLNLLGWVFSPLAPVAIGGGYILQGYQATVTQVPPFLANLAEAMLKSWVPAQTMRSLGDVGSVLGWLGWMMRYFIEARFLYFEIWLVMLILRPIMRRLE